MSKSRSDLDEYYHNKGQEDASDDEYDPPWDDHIGGLTYNSDQARDNDKYNEGWRHTTDQSDSSSSGGCFITTATLSSIGKSDNCEELNAFRNFRDNWLAKQPDGQKLILEYYHVAPRIVKAINSQDDSKKIYNNLWNENIEPCLQLIKDNAYDEAKLIYSNVVTNLKREFLDDEIDR